MKVEIFNWAGDRQARDAITSLGYEHCQIVEGDVLQLANAFLWAGVNVMILHAKPGQDKGLVNKSPIEYILAIDSKSFGQR